MQSHNKGKEKNIPQKVDHPTYQSCVKGFAEVITGIAFNNRYTVASSFDQTIKVFDNSEFFIHQDQPKFLSYKLLDMHPTAICITQKFDFIYYAANNSVYELQFNPKSEDKQYFVNLLKAQNCHKTDIVGIHIDEDRTIITVGQDTHIKIWNLKGEQLKEINTSYIEHYGSSYSSGKLILSSKNADTSLFHIQYGKENTFRALEKIGILRGDKNSIYDVRINDKATRATLVSTTSCRVYNIGVDFKNKEEPKQIQIYENQKISSAASTDHLTVVSIDTDLLLFDQHNQQIDLIKGAAQTRIVSIHLRELHGKGKQYLLCYVQGQEQNKINVFDFTRYK